MHEPRTALSEIEPFLKRELGPTARNDSFRLGGEPLAEASVAVVVPFSWRNPQSGRREDGVLKVLRPGITQRLSEELEALARTAEFLDRRRAHYGLPDFPFRETLETTAQLLQHEVTPEVEQRNLLRAAKRWAASPSVRVPRLYPFSTPRLTAMERIFGRPVTQVGHFSPAARTELAERIVSVGVTDVVFGSDSDALFHGDPHAGNLFATDSGELALLDWSLAGELTKRTRTHLAQISLGALLLDRDHVRRSMALVADRLPDDSRSAPLIDDALRSVRRGARPGLNWLVSLLDEFACAGARFPAETLLFRKSLLTLQGVVTDVAADCRLDAEFTAALMRTLAAEWPARFTQRPGSRDLPSHISNQDLLRIGWSAPATAMRFWTDTWRDWLDKSNRQDPGPNTQAIGR